MAEVTKYQLISNNNNIIADIKAYFSVFRTRKNSPLIYGIVLVFVLVTIFLAFSPSSSSPINDDSYKSHYSFVYSLFFPNSTQSFPQINPSIPQNNATFQAPFSNSSQNLNQTQVHSDEVLNFEHNITSISQSNATFQVPFSNSSQVLNFEHNITSISQSNATFQVPFSNSSQVQNFEHNITSISQNNATFQVPISNNSQNLNKTQVHLDKVQNFEHNNTSISQNLNKTQVSTDKVRNFEQKNSTFTQIPVNNTVIQPEQQKNQTSSQVSVNNNTIVKKPTDLVASLSKNKGNEVSNLVGCDLYDGSWVRDETYPLYKPGSCKLVDEQFNCMINGRPDNDYQKLKWKPNDCSLPRLDPKHMLNLLRGKRLVFVGDSLNRNMWESLVCILKSSIKNKKKVYEAFGRHRFRTEASYSFVFKDYNCTVEFFVSPFLVQQWEVKDKNGATKETLQLDRMVSDADQYKSADYIVFNTGHWWTHDKIKKGEDYYQEGNLVYKQLDVVEAFRRALTTWGRWVDSNIDPQKTRVLFRGYSATHFSGGRWNSGGKCDGETEPIKNETYLTRYPWKMKELESVLQGMKTPVSFLNVTRLTDYRKDGHPSVYRKHLSDDEKKSPLKYQDCSHWCLPGVPDSWNELLYAELLRKQFKDKQGNSP